MVRVVKNEAPESILRRLKGLKGTFIYTKSTFRARTSKNILFINLCAGYSGTLI